MYGAQSVAGYLVSGIVKSDLLVERYWIALSVGFVFAITLPLLYHLCSSPLAACVHNAKEGQIRSDRSRSRSCRTDQIDHDLDHLDPYLPL